MNLLAPLRVILNELLHVGFRAGYNFRPSFMRAVPGQRNFPWLNALAAE
jgi:hypothetical protein